MNKKNIYVSARDVAENAKLNHEIAEELRKHISLSCQCSTLASRLNKKSLATWILWSSQRMTKMYVLLSLITLLPTLALAETCTATPDCKSLGYTQTSCPDGGVKCPWNQSLMFCNKKCAPACEEKKCQTGDVLYGNKKCYTCSDNYKLPGLSPIGVVLRTGMAVALNDVGNMSWDIAKYWCNENYTAGGVSDWDLPSKDVLLEDVHGNINSVQTGLQSATGGRKLLSTYYWSSSYDSNSHDWFVNPVNGDTGTSRYSYDSYNVRCVLYY